MNKVKFHFVANGLIRIKPFLLSKAISLYYAVPQNLLAVTLEDSFGSIKVVLLIKGRVKVSKVILDEEEKKVTLKGQGMMDAWTWYINCHKDACIYYPSMYYLSRIFRLLNQNRHDDVELLSKKIKEYCTEKKITSYQK